VLEPAHVAGERAPALRSQAIFRPRDPAVERLPGLDESRLFEAARVNAEVAVRRAELVPKLSERPGPAGRERARDRESQSLVEDALRVGFQSDVLRT
jgi:hypothetical protein